MKINEVEALAGITKKNIRFYEEQGLISPKRNAENGYREYGEEDVLILRRIRLLRKLDVPIDEIRQMFAGTHTVGDGMRRHLITLERERRNLQHAIEFCESMAHSDIPISQLNTDELLEEMESLENAGTTFRDVQSSDIRKHYAAPVTVAAITVGLMIALSVLLLWAVNAFPDNAPPMWLMMIFVSVFAAVGVGVLLALNQRIREIRRGEIDDAKKY